MQSIHAKRGADVTARKEREARRRKALADQQAMQKTAEQLAEQETVIAALTRKGQEEQAAAEQLSALQAEEQVRAPL